MRTEAEHLEGGWSCGHVTSGWTSHRGRVGSAAGRSVDRWRTASSGVSAAGEQSESGAAAETRATQPGGFGATTGTNQPPSSLGGKARAGTAPPSGQTQKQQKKNKKTKTIRHYSLKMISWGNPRERFTSLALAARLTDWSSMFVSRSAADVNDRLDVRRNPKSLLGSEGREQALICVFMSSPYQASNSSSSLFPSRRQLPKPTVGDSKASMCL